MDFTTTYEKTVKVKLQGTRLAKNISIIMAYILFFSVWVVAAVYNADRFVLVLAAGILSSLMIVALTWKYLYEEYEYSFWYGSLTIAKIYAKRKRKTIVSADIKDLLIIAPATEENIAKASRFEPEETVLSISADNAKDIWLTVTGGKDEKRVLIFFEADERALTVLRKSNHFAFTKSI